MLLCIVGISSVAIETRVCACALLGYTYRSCLVLGLMGAFRSNAHMFVQEANLRNISLTGQVRSNAHPLVRLWFLKGINLAKVESI